MRNPDFNNGLLKVLRNEVPNRPTLFEFYMNDEIYKKLAGDKIAAMTDELAEYRLLINAFKNAGFDHASVLGSSFAFDNKKEFNQIETRSMNVTPKIYNWESFNNFQWPDPESFDYSKLERIKSELPKGMKLIVWGPGGVLEDVMDLMGYDNMCLLFYEEPDLMERMFEAVGSRLAKYYEICAAYDTVGACISNDDWGFNTQTLISPELLRKYVFPWHKKIVENCHKYGKPVILHSCGQLEKVFADIVYDMNYDAKHSFEDSIIPVEEAYEKWHDKIAILGGIDMDYICRSASLKEINERAQQMLERTKDRGGYALGTGNTVTSYLSVERFSAMTSTIVEPVFG